jgi:hypothetical protein
LLIELQKIRRPILAEEFKEFKEFRLVGRSFRIWEVRALWLAKSGVQEFACCRTGNGKEKRASAYGQNLDRHPEHGFVNFRLR